MAALLTFTSTPARASGSGEPSALIGWGDLDGGEGVSIVERTMGQMRVAESRKGREEKRRKGK
jgi:hypothetical protein